MKIQKCYVLLRENGQNSVSEFDIVDKGLFMLVVFEWGILNDGREFIKKAKRFPVGDFQKNPDSLPIQFTLNPPIDLDSLEFKEEEVVLDIVALDPESFDPTA